MSQRKPNNLNNYPNVFINNEPPYHSQRDQGWYVHPGPSEGRINRGFPSGHLVRQKSVQYVEDNCNHTAGASNYFHMNEPRQCVYGLPSRGYPHEVYTQNEQSSATSHCSQYAPTNRVRGSDATALSATCSKYWQRYFNSQPNLPSAGLTQNITSSVYHQPQIAQQIQYQPHNDCFQLSSMESSMNKMYKPKIVDEYFQHIHEPFLEKKSHAQNNQVPLNGIPLDIYGVPMGTDPTKNESSSAGKSGIYNFVPQPQPVQKPVFLRRNTQISQCDVCKFGVVVTNRKYHRRKKIKRKGAQKLVLKVGIMFI